MTDIFIVLDHSINGYHPQVSHVILNISLVEDESAKHRPLGILDGDGELEGGWGVGGGMGS